MILTEVISFATTLSNFNKELERILPGLRGKTQHLSNTQAQPLAENYARTVASQFDAAYGRAQSDQIGHRLAPLWLNLISSGIRWAGTDKTAMMAEWFGTFEQKYGPNGQYGNNTDVLYYAVYGHAMWVLLNMDVDSDTEFSQTVQNDYRAVLIPLLSQMGYDVTKITFTGANGAPIVEPSLLNKASLFGIQNKTLIMVVIAAAALYVVYQIFMRK